MTQILIDSPLLLLFIICALGYGIGNIRIKGNRLGIAAVLFVGLAFGSLSPELAIPNAIFQLGLILFVYSIGLSNGPGFFAGFQKDGQRTFAYVLVILIFPALLTIGFCLPLGINAPTAAGLFAGVATNTAALASVLDYITNTAARSAADSLIAEAVVGYSIVYPIGVIGYMATIAFAERLWKIDYQAEAYALRKQYPMAEPMDSRTVKITKLDEEGTVVRDLMRTNKWNVTLGRMRRGDNEAVHLVHYDTRLFNGDEVVVVGAADEVASMMTAIGEEASVHLSTDSTHYGTGRVFVSNSEVAGQRLATLNLKEKFNVMITRVGRGDTDLLANGDTVIELGDRLRVVGSHAEITEMRKFFGDSYHALSEVNLLSMGLGITLGLLLGMVTFVLPGDISFQLGFAGGPLIVALVLGSLRRTGPIVWTLPYSANLTLRQIGLSFMLAVVGVSSGHTFISTLASSNGLIILVTGTVITLATAFTGLIVGYRLFKIPFGILIGSISVQPAVLSFALERSKNQLPNVGYSLTFPIAIISKIVFAQLIYIFLVG